MDTAYYFALWCWYLCWLGFLYASRNFSDSTDQSTPGYSNAFSDSSTSLLGHYNRYPVYTLPDNPVSLQNITEPRPQEQSHVNESIMDPTPALQERKETLTVRAEVHNLEEFSPLNRRKVYTADSSSIGSSSDGDSPSTSKTPTAPAVRREEADLPDRTSSSGSLHSSDIVSRSSSEHKNKTRESRLNLQEKESPFITGSNMESRSENMLISTSSFATAEMGSILEYSSEAYNSPAYASFSGSSTESNAETENPENPQKRLK
ncbi:hypothetical protein CDAR_507351 [Caerostris darwini]|uniref:Uncharacterized protein n=1 Tax=Caerostris darwini TaxID=1538125 RepID=A0AAV4WD95_9ARAC|nr:hypothetical protein CDAR_507351 [Caerostris darwini]